MVLTHEQFQTAVHLFLAATAAATPSANFHGYLNNGDCEASRTFLSATVTQGYLVGVEPFPIKQVKVSQGNSCPAGTSLQLQLSENTCDSFQVTATFSANGQCAGVGGDGEVTPNCLKVVCA